MGCSVKRKINKIIGMVKYPNLQKSRELNYSKHSLSNLQSLEPEPESSSTSCPKAPLEYTAPL